jgi:hypothetical protein
MAIVITIVTHHVKNIGNHEAKKKNYYKILPQKNPIL